MKKLIRCFFSFLVYNVLPRYVGNGMIGTSVNNLVVFSLESRYKRPQPWWPFRGSNY